MKQLSNLQIKTNYVLIKPEKDIEELKSGLLVKAGEEDKSRQLANTEARHYNITGTVLLVPQSLIFRGREIKQLRQRTGGKFNDRAHLEIKNNCWKGSTADFVITCDCDEFLYTENLVDKLMLLKSQGVTLPTVAGYNMYCEYFPGDYTIPIMQQVKTGVRALHFDKQIIFSPRLKEINFSPGAHACAPQGKLIRNNSVELKLLHYKYLGYDGVRNRHEHYNLRMSDYNKKNGYGAEYGKAPDENFTLIKQSAQPVIQ